MKEPTKTRQTPLTVCKYLLWFLEIFHFKVLHGRRHDNHFLNGNEARMTSQLQYGNQVEFLSLYSSEYHEHKNFKFSGIALLKGSNQNKQIALFAMETKKKTVEPSQLGNRNSYCGSCGINFENVIMFLRWGLAVQSICSVKITKLTNVWKEIEVFVRIGKGQ